MPRVGQRAPLIHTPTAGDVGGDLAKITTRIPPDTQNQVDYADAFGREPIVLLFATPQFCVSRVCGPVVDVAEQVKQLDGDQAAFIHMEIYKDNDPSLEEQRPQVEAFHLPTEPWLFVIDSDGRIATEIEGAFGVEELTRALRSSGRIVSRPAIGAVELTNGGSPPRPPAALRRRDRGDGLGRDRLALRGRDPRRREPTFTVEEHHYALVRVEGLEPAGFHEYEVRLDGERRWPPARLGPAAERDPDHRPRASRSTSASAPAGSRSPTRSPMSTARTATKRARSTTRCGSWRAR